MGKQSLSQYIKNLQNDIVQQSNWELTSSFEQLLSTYNSMLQFTIRGIADNGIEQMHNQLWNDAIRLKMRHMRAERMRQNPNDLYCSKARKYQQNITIGGITSEFLSAKSGNYEQLNTILFNHTWTSDIWTKGTYNQATELMESESIPLKTKLIFISAVTLALMEYYDTYKLCLLFDTYLSPENEISVRSLIGIIFSVQKHEDLITKSVKITERIDEVLADEIFVKQLYTAIMQLHTCKNTEKTLQKLHEEMDMSMYNLSDDMKRKYGMVTINTAEKESDDDNVEELIDESMEENMEKRMQKVANMQRDGQDMHLISFARHKNDPFFSETAHWFYPFDADEPAISALADAIVERTGYSLMECTSILPFCNSDLYTFCLLFSHIGDVVTNAMEDCVKNALGANDKDEIKETLQNARAAQSTPKILIRYYLFDLYRFFYFSPYRKQFYNPFETIKSTFTYSPIQIPLLTNHQQTEGMQRYADYLLTHKEYSMAQTLYLWCTNIDKAKQQKKIGYCEEMEKQYCMATASYKIAMAFGDESEWMLTHYARCLYKSGDYKQAGEQYAQLVQMQPESFPYLYRAGECLLRTAKPADSLPFLHKAHYINGDSDSASDLLGIALSINGQHDKAIAVCKSSLSQAFVHIAKGDSMEAYQLLLKAKEEEAEFEKDYQDIANLFITNGIISSLVSQLFYDAAVMQAL